MTFLTYTVSFKTTQARFFFSEIANLILADSTCISMREWLSPHLPSDFDGLPCPRVRRYDHTLFCQMTAEDGATIT